MKEIIKKLLPGFVLNLYHFSLSLMGAFFYGFPSKKLIVIGVTGTSGKSTTVDLTSRILEEAGFKVASLSSIKFKVGEQERENMLKMTMPGRFKLQKFLKNAVNAGCQYAVLEVTSEGIKQYRHRFIDFDVAVLTNLSPEHIESHGGFENYKKCKGKLFQATKGIHIVNLDDENAEYFLSFFAQQKFVFTTKESRNLTSTRLVEVIKAENVETSSKGVKFRVKDTEFNLEILGRFNVYNALAAICVGLSQGVSLETCRKALQKAKGIPGRMEIVIKDPFTVIVDYAITPVALEKVYKTLSPKPKVQSSRLICVLGSCGGGRDKWKRPVFGRIAAKYCKEVIITNEDPYDEDPMEIINQVADGAKGKAEKILDRREAIRKSLEVAKEGDIVVITGKGCEPWMCVEGGKKIPWDDRKIAREEFQKIYGQKV